jgi:enoyl-CoA hydratase
MTLNYQTLLHKKLSDTVLSISLNRPETANALNTQMALELNDLFSYLSEKSNKYRVVMLSGQGKHFCAGADLKERKGMKVTAWKSQHKAFRDARDAILKCPIPVLAAVQGAAYAGGLELALACDFIYASEDARFALTEVKLGIMPGMGGTQFLPRAVGSRRARELLYTGKPFSAAEALAWGMVNRVCKPTALLSEITACAQAIADNAPLSVAAIKKSVRGGQNLALGDALAYELTHYNSLLASKDRHEGINAFNEKRSAIFTGE